MIPILIIVLSILLLVVLTGFYFAAIVIYPRRFGVEETLEIEKSHGEIDEAEFLSRKKEEVQIKSNYGYLIRCLYFPMEGVKRSIIVSHGITYTLYGSVKYMKILRDLGFNILIYDLRHHGKTGDKNSTFGFYCFLRKHNVTKGVRTKTWT